jgi:hypothetical protein
MSNDQQDPRNAFTGGVEFNSPKSVQQPSSIGWRLVSARRANGLALPHEDIARARGFPDQVSSSPELCT